MADKRWSRKTFLLLAAAVLVGVILVLFTVAGSVLEPVLKKRLHALIVDDADSLYRYSLGSLHADLFGANVTVQNLKIWVDSSRYRELRRQNALPPLTIGLDLKKGQVKGISLLALLIGKKLKIRKVASQEGQVTLARHYTRRGSDAAVKQPFWKAVRPSMQGLTIDELRLDNMQLAYRDMGAEEVQLQFRRCDAVLQDIRIDSALLADTTRLGYLGRLSLHLHDLAFLSADSVYKLNVNAVQYSSANRQLTLDGLHLRPSNSYDQLLRLDTVGKTYFTLQTEKIRLQNMRLEQFINANAIRAEKLIVQQPVVAVYFDRTAPKDVRSKVGNYPHQLLEKAPMDIAVKQLQVANMQLTYTEKSDRTGKEGKVYLEDLNLVAQNLTNDSTAKKTNAVTTLTANGKIMGSPISARFTFYPGSANGRFDAAGTVGNLAASQLSPLAESLAGLRIPSLAINEVNFSMQGNDSSSRGTVRMRYSNLVVEVLKANRQTGDVETNRFFSKLLNRYLTHPANPGANGTERVAQTTMVNRLLWYSFFGLVWKTIFFGMQDIMLKP